MKPRQELKLHISFSEERRFVWMRPRKNIFRIFKTRRTERRI